MSRQRSVKFQKRSQQEQNQPQYSTKNIIEFTQFNRTQQKKQIELIPRTINQEQLILALRDDRQHIVVASGPAGTGKTYLAMLAAIRALRSNACKRIILTRPAVAVEGEKHGFLPGDIFSKMEPWTRPLLDVLREYHHPREIARMIDDQIIEISPLSFMRGRTFKNAWVVADEMQNATPAQIKMLLTRIGQESKIIITGDVEQSDRRTNANGLIDLCERLQKGSVNGIAVCLLESRDVQRHSIIGSVLNLYAD